MRRPAIDSALAATVAADAFGLRGELRELPSYADRNFTVAGHVIKFAFGPPGELEFEAAAMEWLASRSVADTPRTPGVRRALTGAAVVTAQDRGAVSCAVRASTFVSGRLLADVEHPAPRLWLDLGRRSGQLVRALTGFTHPLAQRELIWDLRRASWLSEFVGLHDDAATRDAVRSAILQFRGRALVRADRLPVGVIHGDLNECNVVVDDDELGIHGVFDFGDMSHTWLVNEVAIAATYAMMIARNADDAAGIATLCDVAAGHHEVRPLSALEIDLLLDLVRARLAVSLTSAARSRLDDPDNAYAQGSDAGARGLLGALSEIDDVEVVRQLCDRLEVAPPERFARLARADILTARTRHLGPSLSLAYDEPLHLVRGEGTWLFDADDRAHLDCVNNVCHVGHSEARVVEAAHRQMARLNTNTRYLHENIVEYAAELIATLPAPLEVCFFVCSGTEANELALRIARAATGRRDVIAVEHGYHGNSSTLIDVSSYKHHGPGGGGAPSWVHTITTPDPRGEFGDDGPAYARAIDAIAERLGVAGRAPAAFLTESVYGCAGQVFPASGFLSAAFERARAAGAVCIADEVQVGFGRVGPRFWGFALQDAVPDIVTLGKPIGNGHPLGAVVTTRALADAFANGMEYFNTFGGNPVSAAVGTAVLRVIADDDLPTHAAAVGAHLIARLRDRVGSDARVAEVRGAGLFVGVDLAGHAATCHAIVEHARRRRVLISVDGPGHDVLKIKPPLRFDRADADLLVDVLAHALAVV